MAGNLIDDLLRFFKAVPAQCEASLGEFLSEPSACFRLLSQPRLFLFGGNRPSAGVPLPEEQEKRQSKANDQGEGDGANRSKNGLVSPHQLLETVEVARRTGEDRFIAQVTLNVHRQAVGRFVAARAVFLQGFHHDPVEVPSQ